jgi:hypothetical protein
LQARRFYANLLTTTFLRSKPPDKYINVCGKLVKTSAFALKTTRRKKVKTPWNPSKPLAGKKQNLPRIPRNLSPEENLIFHEKH